MKRFYLLRVIYHSLLAAVADQLDKITADSASHWRTFPSARIGWLTRGASDE